MDSIRDNILKTIRDEEKRLTELYKDKWMIARIHRKYFAFDKPMIVFRTVFKIEEVRFTALKIDDPKFLKIVVLSGVDSLGKKRSMTVDIDNIQVFDDEYSAKLLAELEKSDENSRRRR